jgi:hypothetical protein
MTLDGLVPETLSGETNIHKTNNSRLYPLQSREHVNSGMLGVAQPVMGLHCKADI